MHLLATRTRSGLPPPTSSPCHTIARPFCCCCCQLDNRTGSFSFALPPVPKKRNGQDVSCRKAVRGVSRRITLGTRPRARTRDHPFVGRGRGGRDQEAHCLSVRLYPEHVRRCVLLFIDLLSNFSPKSIGPACPPSAYAKDRQEEQKKKESYKRQAVIHSQSVPASETGVTTIPAGSQNAVAAACRRTMNLSEIRNNCTD